MKAKLSNNLKRSGIQQLRHRHSKRKRNSKVKSHRFLVKRRYYAELCHKENTFDMTCSELEP